MNVVNSPTELESFLKKATVFSEEHHVVISKFITDAKEIDLDGVAKDGKFISLFKLIAFVSYEKSKGSYWSLPFLST